MMENLKRRHARKSGTHFRRNSRTWIPACAGTAAKERLFEIPVTRLMFHQNGTHPGVAACQFTQCRPGTRENSRSLRVTSVAP